MNLGYACINMNLSNPKQFGSDREKITTNRSMIKRTFQEKGVGYVSELALQNVIDLNHIIKWNEKHNIKFFRMSSEIFPWASEYKWEDLPDIKMIKVWLENAGLMAEEYGQRLTSHPGPFNVLTSPHSHVVDNCINDLSIHGEVFDLIGLSRTPFNKINIHIGFMFKDTTMTINHIILHSIERISRFN